MIISRTTRAESALPSRRIEDRRVTVDLVALVALLLAIALRLYHLDFQSMWGDEAFALQVAREPLERLVPMLAASEPHPPLYYGLLHVWRALSGESDFALRLFSTLFSMVVVAAVYGLGRRLVDRRTALAAALIAAANPFQIWYAQEIRMYTMLVATTAVSTMLFYGAVTKGGRRRWLLYTLVTTIAIYTHYHALFIVVFENLFALLWWLRQSRAGRGRVPGGWRISQAVLAGVFLPWLYVAQSIFRQWSGWMPMVALPDMIVAAFSAHTLGTSFPSQWLNVALLVLACWSLLATTLLARRLPSSAIFLALYALVPLFGAWLLGELIGRSMFHERYLIGISPAFYLLLGYGAGWVGRRWLLSLAGAGVIILFAGLALQNHYFDWHYQKDDLRALARYVDANVREGDVVVASITRQWLYQHYASVPVPLYLLPPDATVAEIPAALSGATVGYRRILNLPYARSDIDYAVEQWLAANAYPASERWFNTARVEIAGLGAATEMQTIKANFANRVYLDSYGLPRLEYEPGEVLGLAAAWRVEQAGEKQLKASLRLVDSRAHVYAQADPSLGTSDRPLEVSPRQQYGLLLPVDLPPGDYGLELHVYDPAAGRELPLIDDRGGTAGFTLALAKIHVVVPRTIPAAEAQVVKQPANAAFGKIARLTGFDLPAAGWQAGEKITFALSWQALAPDGVDYKPVLHLMDSGGTEAARHVIANTPSPFAGWRPGELTRQIHDWRLPPGLRQGNYTVRLTLASPDGSVLPTANGGRYPLGVVSVAARPQYAVPNPPEHPTAYTLGFAKLTGYDLSTTILRPGDSLDLTLHWQALTETEESYKVFTHLLSAEQRVVGQQDSVPCQGQCPTTAWAESEHIADRYKLTLQPDAGPGKYLIEVGMYDPSDGRRLPVLDTSGRQIDDRIILVEVSVP